MTARCVKIVTSGVPTIHFLCKVKKVKLSWNPTTFNLALDTGGFTPYELVISQQVIQRSNILIWFNNLLVTTKYGCHFLCPFLGVQ